MANASSQFPPGDYQDLEIRILDQEFNLLNDTVLFYDEKMYLPVHNGIDFTNENNIWVSVFERITTNFSGTEVFDVHIFDSDMTLKGTKTLGGDKRYWLYDLTATSDGGCLIVGMVPDFDGSTLKDAYVLKLMPDDILTNIEDPNTSMKKLTSIFPNPFNDVLFIGSSLGNFTFSLFTIHCQEVIKQHISNSSQTTIQTSHLKPGIYFYTIESGNFIIQSGKIIKN
jgi:hypothetical protein